MRTTGLTKGERLHDALDLVGLGRRLKMVREEQGIPATRLDELAGVGRGSVHRIEHGQRPEISLGVMAKIAHYLNVRLDWLVWGLDEDSGGPMAPHGLDVPTTAFLSQIHRLPGLLAHLESGRGAGAPLHIVARGLKQLREMPAKHLGPNGAPKEGWAAFFNNVAKKHRT